jgi:hypothetical protein
MINRKLNRELINKKSLGDVLKLRVTLICRKKKSNKTADILFLKEKIKISI